MNDKIALQKISNIEIKITDQENNIQTITITGQELIERIQDVRYQTLCYAVTSGISENIAKMSIECNKMHPIIQQMLTYTIKQDIDYYVQESLNKKYYFKINNERYEFDSKLEAEYILEHINHINNKLPK